MLLPRPSTLHLPILFLLSTTLTTATLSPLPPRTPTPSRPETSTSTSLQDSSLLSTLLALADTTSPSAELDTFPLARRCANPCGYYGQVCCGAGQQCYTNALTQAACTVGLGAANPASGYWSYYTMTNTYLQTQTLSTWVPVAAVTSTTPYVPLPAAPLPATATETQTTEVCNTGAGYSQCGTACCSSSEYCYQAGVCMASGSTSGLSAPLRVTSSTLLTLTTYISPTTTEAFQSAIATSNVTLTESESSNGHLSSGAIAGIVIGVIFLLILLFLLLLFFCFKAVWDAFFGGKNRRDDRRRVVTEERYNRYNDHDSRSSGRREWYAGNNGPKRPQRREKESNGLGWAGVAAGLGGMAAALGWRRRQEEKRRQQQRGGRYQKTETTESGTGSYTESSYVSEERDERVYRNGRLVDERYDERRTRDNRRG